MGYGPWGPKELDKQKWLICVYIHISPKYIGFPVALVVKKKVKVAQLCLILWDPMDCSPPGSSVCGILQDRIS